MEFDRRCGQLAETQYGLISRTQATELGLTRRMIGRRLESGRWRVVFPKVYAISGVPLGRHAYLMAAALWGGSGAAVSHRAAAEVWSLQRFPFFRPEITQPQRSGAPDGLKLFRHANLPPHHVTHLQGLPITTCSRTLLDIAGLVPPWQLDRCVHLALQRRDTTIDDLHLMVGEEGRRGRRGTAATRLELAMRTQAGKVAGSRLAERFLRFLVENGFPRPLAEYRIHGPEGFVADVDFAYPTLKIAFEVDHFFTHGDLKSFERDRERDRILMGLGWTVIRVTAESLNSRRKLRDQIAEILSSRHPTPNFTSSSTK